MEIEELRKLVRLMEESGLVELEVEDRAGKVRLVRSGARGDARAMRSPARSARVAGEAGGPAAPQGQTHRAVTAILSPMVGTFYRAPAPEAGPFVEVGDVVSIGQIVCIVEAMKMMNEVHAETAGRVVRVIAENGASVEYGSPLFEIDPGA